MRNMRIARTLREWRRSLGRIAAPSRTVSPSCAAASATTTGSLPRKPTSTLLESGLREIKRVLDSSEESPVTLFQMDGMMVWPVVEHGVIVPSCYLISKHTEGPLVLGARRYYQVWLNIGIDEALVDLPGAIAQRIGDAMDRYQVLAQPLSLEAQCSA